MNILFSFKATADIIFPAQNASRNTVSVPTVIVVPDIVQTIP